MNAGRRAMKGAGSVLLAAMILLGAGCSKKAEPPQQETLPPERPAPAPPEPSSDEEPGIASGAGLRIGALAPLVDVKLLSVDDRRVSLADARRNNGLLVVFTCNTCPYARAWEQRIVDLGHEYLKHDIGVIAINANDPGVNPGDGFEEMKTRAKERALQYPYVVDEKSELARAFGASRTPEAFLFGPDGKLAYHGTIDDNAQGPKDVTEHYLRDALAAVVSGQPVPVPETKSLGCGIKFRS